jgi:hypothetical protein
VKRAEGRESGFERFVINPLGMQLQINPFIDPHRGHAIDLTRPRTERQPLQGMLSSLGPVHVRGSAALF